MYRIFKRVLDLILAVVLLVICFIPMVIISILIKLDSRGPVFFRQERTGKGGKVFTLYKFRSMAKDNDAYDFKTEDRITRIGRILRKTSLDELGQLINIIRGDMSFIGPRPWMTDYYENMTEKQRHRCDVMPGITGLAQASGRNNLSIFDKIDLDLKYVNNLSFKMDVYVFLKTVKCVLTGEGFSSSKSTIGEEIRLLEEQHLSKRKETAYKTNKKRKVKNNEVSAKAKEKVFVGSGV